MIDNIIEEIKENMQLRIHLSIASGLESKNTGGQVIIIAFPQNIVFFWLHVGS